jgi:hypothetical protein
MTNGIILIQEQKPLFQWSGSTKKSIGHLSPELMMHMVIAILYVPVNPFTTTNSALFVFFLYNRGLLSQNIWN